MPDLGIGEALAALGGASGLGGLGSLFGIGEAAAAPAAEAGLGADAAWLATPAASSLTVPASQFAAETAGAGAGAELGGAAAGASGFAVPALDTLLGSGASATGGGILSPPPTPTMGADGLPAMFTSGSGIGAPTGPVAAGGVTSAGPTAQAIPTGGVGATGPAAVGAPAGVSPGGIDLSSAAAGGSGGGAKPLEGGGITDFFKSWGGPALGAAGLGYTALTGNKQAPTTKALQQEAATLAPQAAALTEQGNQYASFLAQGTLPAGIQAQVDSSVKAAKQQILSRYASQGLPADPNKNSTLQSELQEVDRKALEMSGKLGTQLLQSGTGLISAGTQISGLENQLLMALSGIDQTQTANIGKAIASFAAALAPSKVNLNFGGKGA